MRLKIDAKQKLIHHMEFYRKLKFLNLIDNFAFAQGQFLARVTFRLKLIFPAVEGCCLDRRI